MSDPSDIAAALAEIHVAMAQTAAGLENILAATVDVPGSEALRELAEGILATYRINGIILATDAEAVTTAAAALNGEIEKRLDDLLRRADLTSN